MHTKRVDRDGWTEIALWNEGERSAYHITCMDVDSSPTGARQPPTARISLLCATQADIAGTRRLAAEYTYVADVAEQLQAEKRLAYQAKFGEG